MIAADISGRAPLGVLDFDVGSTVQQVADHLAITAKRRAHQGRRADRVLRVDLGAARTAARAPYRAARCRGGHQRRHPAAIGRPHVRAFRDQQLGDRRVPARRRHHQGGAAVLVTRLDSRAGVDERLRGLAMAVRGGKRQRRSLASSARVRVRAGRQQRLDAGRISLHRRFDQLCVGILSVDRNSEQNEAD